MTGIERPLRKQSGGLFSGAKSEAAMPQGRKTQGKAAAELGSHFASKAMGACSREPRAKIFARSANILVFTKRRRNRFAFTFCRAGCPGAEQDRILGFFHHFESKKSCIKKLFPTVLTSFFRHAILISEKSFGGKNEKNIIHIALFADCVFCHCL